MEGVGASGTPALHCNCAARHSSKYLSMHGLACTPERSDGICHSQTSNYVAGSRTSQLCRLENGLLFSAAWHIGRGSVRSPLLLRVWALQAPAQHCCCCSQLMLLQWFSCLRHRKNGFCTQPLWPATWNALAAIAMRSACRQTIAIDMVSSQPPSQRDKPQHDTGTAVYACAQLVTIFSWIAQPGCPRPHCMWAFTANKADASCSSRRSPFHRHVLYAQEATNGELRSAARPVRRA